MVGSYAVARILGSLRLLRVIEWLILGISLLLCLILAENTLLSQMEFSLYRSLVRLDPGVILILFFIIWLWWRGITLAQAVIRPTMAWRRFEVGLLFVLSFILIAGRLGMDLPGLGWYIFFLFTGLLAVVLSRVIYVGTVRGSRRNPFDLRWLGSTILILASGIGISAIVGSILTGQYRLFLDLLTEAIRLSIGIFIFIVSLPGLLLGYIIGPVLPWLRNLLNFRLQQPEQEELFLDQYSLPFQKYESIPLPISFQSIFFWAVVGGIVILLLLKVKRAASASIKEETQEPQSLLKRGEARKLIKKGLLDFLDQLSRQFSPVQKFRTSVRIREIYNQLLALCSELGKPRPAYKTPNEFQFEIEELFTSLPNDVNTITRAYVHVRYGEIPETKEELLAVEDAWQRIEEAGQRLKQAGVGKLQRVEVKEVLRPGH